MEWYKQSLLIIVMLVAASTIGKPLQQDIGELRRKCKSLNITRIVGGTGAKIRDFPFMAQVIIKQPNNGHKVCGGAIIAKDKILTAAHCDVKPKDSVIYGTDQAYPRGGYLATVKFAARRGDYDRRSLANDIAVLYLEKELIFGPDVAIIELAKPGDQLTPSATIAGFGSTSYPTTNYPTQLQSLNTGITTLEFCQSKPGTYHVTSGNICTLSQSGHGICKADSGSPVVGYDLCQRKRKLIGIVSFGTPCGKGKPDVHASVEHFHSWIASQL